MFLSSTKDLSLRTEAVVREQATETSRLRKEKRRPRKVSDAPDKTKTLRLVEDLKTTLLVAGEMGVSSPVGIRV